MFGVVFVVLLLWRVEPLTHQRIMAVSAVCAYLFTYLEVIGGGADGRPALEATAVNGTVWFFTFCLVSWLLFRKRIPNPVEPEDDTDESDEAPNP